MFFLDWDTDDFYASRKDMIDERLLQISSKKIYIKNFFVHFWKKW